MDVEGTAATGASSTGPCAEGGGLGSAFTESEDSRRAKIVQSEVDRLKLLPASSAYAIHRLRVVNKMLELLKVDPQNRTKTDVDELELLFATLSF